MAPFTAADWGGLWAKIWDREVVTATLRFEIEYLKQKLQDIAVSETFVSVIESFKKKQLEIVVHIREFFPDAG